MKNIYCISGLGADSRIFQNIHIDGYRLVHIPWPEYSKYDTLGSYAVKVAAYITDDEPYVIGLSFGGMLAVEIDKILPLKKLVVISSVKTIDELPKWNALIRKIVTAQLIPPFIFKLPNPVLFDRFGAHTPDEKKLLTAILRDSDGQMMSRIMRGILLWKNHTYRKHLVHIHGDADRIIPPHLLKGDYWIKGGTHMMVYNRATEINHILQQEFAPI